MRIACPACNAAYQVPDEQLREGRVVRCARCGTDWAPIEAIPTEPEPEAERPAPVAEAPAPEPRRMAPEQDIPIPVPPVLPKAPPVPRGSLMLAVAWAVSLAVVAAAVVALLAGRERVMQNWPPSIRAYAALGMAGHPAGSEGRE